MAEEPRKDVGMFITSDPDKTTIEKPGQDPASAVPHLPLRLLLVSNLVPQTMEVDWSQTSRVRRVDKNTFDAVLKDLNPRLTIEVSNQISKNPKTLEVELGFADLEAFHPVAVAQQVSVLAPLLRIRGLVMQVRDGSIDLHAFREQLGGTGIDEDQAAQLYQALSAPEAPAVSSAQSPASADGADDMLDRLLGLVDVGTSPQETQPSSQADQTSDGLFGSLVGAVAGEASSRPKIARTATDQLLGDIDGMLGEQLNAVYNHPAFRQLEAAWRGLKFLVDRLDFRRDVQLEVLPVAKNDLSEALYYQVLLPEHQGDTGKPPLSAVLLDFAFDSSKADIDQMEDLAESGASLQTPLIASAAADFFGVAEYSGFVKLPPLWQQFERPEYIAFNKLREKKDARYLSLAVPAFLLRLPYGKAHPAGTIQFEEKGGVWGNASLAVGAVIANSFVKTGWPTHLLGTDRRLDDLPTMQGAQGHSPLSVLIPDSKLSDFAKGGFVVLNGQTNRDVAYLARAQTACMPEAYEDLMAATEARIHVTLACQLFVSRAAHYILTLQDHLSAGEDVDALVKEVETRLRAFFRTEGQVTPPDTVTVEHVKEANLPDHVLLAVRMRTPPFVLDRPVSLVLGMQVPKATEPA